MTLHLVWAVLGMLVLTFGIRLSFLVFGHRLRFPDCLQRSLRYVPAAVLTALIADGTGPARRGGPIARQCLSARHAGGSAGGHFSRHTLAAILSGFVVYGLWRWLGA